MTADLHLTGRTDSSTECSCWPGELAPSIGHSSFISSDNRCRLTLSDLIWRGLCTFWDEMARSRKKEDSKAEPSIPGAVRLWRFSRVTIGTHWDWQILFIRRNWAFVYPLICTKAILYWEENKLQQTNWDYTDVSFTKTKSPSTQGSKRIYYCYFGLSQYKTVSHTFSKTFMKNWKS